VRRACLAAVSLSIAVAAAPPAHAQDAEVALRFSARSVLGGEAFTLSGQLPGAAADAGRVVELYEKRAPFPGAWAIVQTSVAGPDGEFAFTATPGLKAYWAVAAQATPTRPRFVSRGHLVAVRRKVSIRTSTRRPRAGRPVRFSGFVSPAYPAAMRAVAMLQRRTSRGRWVTVRRMRVRAAGAFSSYRVRARVWRRGAYRVVVPPTTLMSRGASVAIAVRIRG
jgi:hypothetical protein